MSCTSKKKKKKKKERKKETHVQKHTKKTWGIRNRVVHNRTIDSLVRGLNCAPRSPDFESRHQLSISAYLFYIHLNGETEINCTKINLVLEKSLTK